MIARRTTYLLLAGLLLTGCGKKGLVLFKAGDVKCEIVATEPVLEPEETVEPMWVPIQGIDCVESLLESSEELAEIQAAQFEKREQELEAIQLEVEAIRKQLLLERFQKLEAEAKEKKWREKEQKPKAKLEAKRFEEWQYIQQQRVDLGVPEIEDVPIKNMMVAEEPDWRKRGD